MRRLFPFALLLVLTALACSNLLPATTPAPVTVVLPTPVVAGGGSTAAAPPTQPAAPPAQPPSPTPAAPTALPGTPVQFGSSSIVIPQGLNLALQGFQADFGYAEDALMGTGTMKVIKITRFGVSPQDVFCKQGCIDIIPVADAQKVLGRFAFPPEGQNATVLYETRKQTLTFAGGQGTRSLEVQGQGMVLVSNANLRYVFRGYTQNGQYAVYATLPITAPGLPSGETPDANTNPNVFTALPPAADPAQWDAFNQQAVQYLQNLPANQFAPALNLLDALIGSVRP